MANLQDVLSSIKSFAKSDTGKNVAKVVGLLAAGSAGGAEGIKAYGNVFERFKREEERKKKEEERLSLEEGNRNTRKIQQAKAELDLELARERLAEQKTKNYADLQKRIMDANFGTGGLHNATSKTNPEKYGKITPYDVAVEPMPERSAGASRRGGSSTSDALPKPPAPTPVSIKEEKLVASGELDAAKWAAKIANAMGIVDAGKEAWDANKLAISEELGKTGLSKEQKAAAWKELARQVMPGRYEQLQAEQMAGYDPEYSFDEKLVGLYDTARQIGGTGLGMVGGAALGAPFGPAGMVAGGALGAGVGKYTTDAIMQVVDRPGKNKPMPATSESQHLVNASLPEQRSQDVSFDRDFGVGQSASALLSPDDKYRVEQIADGLIRAGANINSAGDIATQLYNLPEISGKQPKEALLMVEAIITKIAGMW